MSLRCERIGVSKEWVSKNLPYWRKMLEESTPDQFPREMLGHNLSLYQRETAAVAIYSLLIDSDHEAQKWGRLTIAQADRHFFGEWRLSMPDNPARPEENGYYAKGGGRWSNEYRTAVALASAFGDWASAAKLSIFPEDASHNPLKEELPDYRPMVPWYLLLAEYLARGRTRVYDCRLDLIRRDESRAAKFYAECLDDIVSKQVGRLKNSFADQMKYYIKHQKSIDEAEYVLAIDGTILYHLAAREGLSIELQNSWRDHLIIF